MPLQRVIVNRKCSKSRIARILKSYKKDIKMHKGVEYMVLLCYILFLRRLAAGAREAAFSKKLKYVGIFALKEVIDDVLSKSRG